MVIYQAVTHPAEWWDQFATVSEKFDAAIVTEKISDLILEKIRSQLLRREAEIAVEVVVRGLNKPNSEELAYRGKKATGRLVATVRRLDDRSTKDKAGTDEAAALCHALQGRWSQAAAAMEEQVGTHALMRAFLAAMRLEQFDMSVALRLLKAGQTPHAAVQTGLAVGRYGWWPTWLLVIVTERALDGRLDADMIAALDRCAYAELSPAQARVAARLLSGDEMMIDASADRLEGLGEPAAAQKLREGDLTTVALAARLIPIH